MRQANILDIIKDSSVSSASRFFFFLEIFANATYELGNKTINNFFWKGFTFAVLLQQTIFSCQKMNGTNKAVACEYFPHTYLLTYLALQPVFGLGLITKVTPFLSILR
jgi:hypothetical protein